MDSEYLCQATLLNHSLEYYLIDSNSCQEGSLDSNFLCLYHLRSFAQKQQDKQKPYLRACAFWPLTFENNMCHLAKTLQQLQKFIQ